MGVLVYFLQTVGNIVHKTYQLVAFESLFHLFVGKMVSVVEMFSFYLNLQIFHQSLSLLVFYTQQYMSAMFFYSVLLILLVILHLPLTCLVMCTT